jgi:hypothetical protein
MTGHTRPILIQRGVGAAEMLKLFVLVSVIFTTLFGRVGKKYPDRWGNFLGHLC